MFNNYFDKIIKTSENYLKKILTDKEFDGLIKDLKSKKFSETKDYVHYFDTIYCDLVKKKYQSEYEHADKKFNSFLDNSKSNLKIVWGDCLNALKKMDSESVQLMVTSPPYYNAREYSQWRDVNEYLDDMTEILKETYRVLDNNRVWVFNVGDIFDNPNTKTKSVWGKQRIPLGAYFTKIFEDIGFTFVDDFIWDKGEVQSERNKNSGTPYPLYQYPLNCYEHILVFHKHRLDLTRYPCPRCGSLDVNGNTQSMPGLQSWECKNEKCFERSESNRGKRFSKKTNITQSPFNQTKENAIELDFIKRWRRDIIKLGPVIKINSKGDNTVGHTAPFPPDIPEMAIKMFSYVGEKVLDPFAGSFTSPKVAAQLNRVGVGIELNKKEFGKAIIKNIDLDNDDFFKNKIKYDEFDLTKEEKLNKQI